MSRLREHAHAVFRGVSVPTHATLASLPALPKQTLRPALQEPFPRYNPHSFMRPGDHGSSPFAPRKADLVRSRRSGCARHEQCRAQPDLLGFQHNLVSTLGIPPDCGTQTEHRRLPPRPRLFAGRGEEAADFPPQNQVANFQRHYTKNDARSLVPVASAERQAARAALRFDEQNLKEVAAGTADAIRRTGHV